MQSKWCKIAATFFTGILLFFGCHSDKTSDSDTNTTDDIDTNTDSDPDIDSDSDTEFDDYWDWQSAPIPAGHCYGTIRILALSEHDVVICISDRVDIPWVGRFDGEKTKIEKKGISCESLFALDEDNVWTLGADKKYIPIVLKRNGDHWDTQNIMDSDKCSLETIIGDNIDDLILVGKCGDSDRKTWKLKDDVWEATTAPVPSVSQLENIEGAFMANNELTYYGDGGLTAGDEARNLDFPSARVYWADSLATGQLVATDGDALFSYDGKDWEKEVECKANPKIGVCWERGLVGALDGDIFVCGGDGATGDSDIPGDWRLNRWNDSRLITILEPCGGKHPKCKVDDISRTNNTLFAAVMNNSGNWLFWHSLPK